MTASLALSLLLLLLALLLVLLLLQPVLLLMPPVRGRYLLPSLPKPCPDKQPYVAVALSHASA